MTLLGGPGTGKSAHLRFLVKRFHETWLGTSHSARLLPPQFKDSVPIFADLSAWKDSKIGLSAFLQAQIKSVGVPELAERFPDLMERGRVILLLDGLTEMPPLDDRELETLVDDPRSKAIARIGDDEKLYCVLTCRRNDFVDGFHWRDLYLQSLTKEQIEVIGAHLYRKDRNGQQMARAFVKSVWESRDARRAKLTALAENPFFCRNCLAITTIEPSGEEGPSIKQNCLNMPLRNRSSS